MTELQLPLSTTAAIDLLLLTILVAVAAYSLAHTIVNIFTR